MTLIRRATFDLIGLPPTPEEVEAFLADDVARGLRPGGRPPAGQPPLRRALGAALARRGPLRRGPGPLVQAPPLPERVPLSRLGGRRPQRRHAVRSVRPGADRRRPAAGRARPSPKRLPALGFFALGPVYYGDRKKFDQIDDRIDTLTRGFLGLTVACARCHDHKFDPIPTADYYALAGVFASTEYEEAPFAPPEQVEAYKKAQEAIGSKDARSPRG